MRLVSLLFNALAFNVLAAEDLSDFEKGLQCCWNWNLINLSRALTKARQIVMTLRWTIFLALLDEGPASGDGCANYPEADCVTV